MNTIIKNGNVFTNGKLSVCDVLVSGEKIKEIAKNIESAEAKVIDASGKLVLPGVIDAHVHYNMKTKAGYTADDFTSGSISAAMGGVTTFIDFASPVEGLSLLEALKRRENEAKTKSYIDYSFHSEITGAFQQNFDEFKELREYGINSLKIYTTYDDMQLQGAKLPLLFKKAKEYGMLVIVHAEDDQTVTELKQKFIAGGKTAAEHHADSRPAEAEKTAIVRILKIAKKENCPVYFVHVSTEYGVRLITEAIKNGQEVYGETCPHYLLLTDDCYKGQDPQKYIMTPPLRKKPDCESLWEAVRTGTLQCAVTDHCSFNIKDKLKYESCFDAIPGIGGSETLLPLMYSESVVKRGLTVQRLVELLAENPAKMFGLYPQKGTLSVGSDADIVIIDPDKETVIDGTRLHSLAEYSVFDGFKVKGLPVCTISRGEIVCKDGEIVAKSPKGKFVKCGTLPKNSHKGGHNES